MTPCRVVEEWKRTSKGQPANSKFRNVIHNKKKLKVKKSKNIFKYFFKYGEARISVIFYERYFMYT
jgi:hypothetical protein